MDSDDDLSSSLASSDSVVVESNLSSGDENLLSVLEHSDFSSELSASASLDWGGSDDDSAGLGTLLSVDGSDSDQSLSVLSDSELFNSVDSDLELSVVNSDLVARALLVSDDDVLSSLGANLDSGTPSSDGDLVLLNVLGLDLELVSVVSVLESTVSSSPNSNLGLGAGAWLLLDDDDLSGSSTSDDSASDSEFLSLDLDDSSSDLDSSEVGSDLLA